jgi:hypothetical protein
MTAKFRDPAPDDPVYQEGVQSILQPPKPTPRPTGGLVRGRRQGGMPSVLLDNADLFDDYSWVDLDDG